MILLLGGTTEARLFLTGLIDAHIPAIVSTAYEFAGEFIEEHPLIRHISGKLDQNEMAELIDREEVKAVVDATHPHATQVSENARAASDAAGAAYIRVGRRAIEPLDYEGAVYVDSMREAARVAAGLGETIFLATGSNQVQVFAGSINMAEHRVYVRVLPDEGSIAKCLWAGFADDSIITGVGPFGTEQNEMLWKALGVEVVVTKESGREGGFLEKVDAAARLGVKLVVVRRPAEDNEDAVDVETAIASVRRLLGKAGATASGLQ